MTMDLQLDLGLPAQDMEQFDHFPLSEEGAREWAGQLPVTNIREVSARLLAALDDLNRSPLPPLERFRVMGALATEVRVTLANLTRRLLKQPLVLPEEPRQLAQTAESLLRALQLGYSIVAAETLHRQDSIRSVNPVRLLCESLYMAIYFAGRGILLALQLHHPASAGSWQALHRLYAVAEWQDIAGLAVNDTPGEAPTVGAAYLQALLLGCCKPNQLQQADLQAVHAALGQWSASLRIDRPDALEGLFAVDLDSDKAAVYSALFGSSRRPGQRVIDTAGFVAALQARRNADGARDGRSILLDTGLTLPAAMVDHLIDALDAISMRNFKRTPSDAPMLVALGITGAHHHAADASDFNQLLYGENRPPGSSLFKDANPFLHDGPRRDHWSQANPAKDFVREEETDPRLSTVRKNVELDTLTANTISVPSATNAERDVPVYRVQQVNAGPGGYCLDWGDNLPDALNTGDLMSVQERPGGGWSVAVIRWVSTLEPSRTLVGVELLSPQVTAVGVQAQQKVGENLEPQRALLLPRIQLIGQPPTLLLPRTGFREGAKVAVKRHGTTRLARLQRQLTATQSFVQFEFQEIRQKGDVVADDQGSPLTATYDSVWSHI